MIIKALVPVRSGSKRVDNKNVRPFAGSNLLEIKLQQLLRIRELDGIVVNSNSDEMLEIASRYPVELVKRDDRYATDTVCMSDVFEHMAETFPGDVVVYAAVTYPLLADDTVSTVIRLFRERGAHDSVVPVSRIRHFMLRDGAPLNYDPDRFPKSQDLPAIHALTWSASVVHRDVMIARKHTVGARPFLHEIDDLQALDIDTPYDFLVAETLYRTLQAERVPVSASAAVPCAPTAHSS